MILQVLHSQADTPWLFVAVTGGDWEDDHGYPGPVLWLEVKSNRVFSGFCFGC